MLLGQESLPIVQLSALPVLVAFLWFLRVGGVRVPRLLIVSAAVLSSLLFWIGYSTRSLTGNRIVVARFIDDPLGADSRIFRESLEKQLAENSESHILRSGKGFETLNQMRKRFPDTRHHDVVVAGGRESVMVYFPPWRNKRINAEIADFRKLIGFDFILQPPAVFLSNPREPGSVSFLANLLAASIKQFSTQLATSAVSEVLLIESARIEAHWKSRAHRALPAWILGNEALMRAFKTPQIQPAELGCAIKWYGYAAGLFKPDDNPELAGAIYNNWGVALYVRAWIEGRSDDREAAVLLFKRGQKTKTYPSPFGVPLRSWQSARSNLNLLEGRSSLPTQLLTRRALKKNRTKEGGSVPRTNRTTGGAGALKS